MARVALNSLRLSPAAVTHLNCPTQGPGMWVTLVAAVATGIAVVIGAVAALRRRNGG